jgi:tape measure domain-containing protein
MATSADYIIRLRANNSDLKRKLAESRSRMRQYNSTVSSISRSVGTHMSALFAVGSVVYFARAQYQLIKQIDSLDKSLKAVQKTSDAYNKSTSFLSKLAEEAGVGINSLTKSYIKFTAAAQGTKLEGDIADDVFRKMTKSAAVLGLSAADTEGILYALNQMISKGTVSSEELKRQLGDRLPGAFRIMTEALGVTQKELLKLLQTGALMTEDVLPKFAAQVEKAFGADKISKVNTLTAAENRLNTAWIEFVKSVEGGEGKISNVLISITTALTNVVKKMKELNGDKSADFIDGFDYYKRILDINNPKDLQRVYARFDKFTKEFEGLGNRLKAAQDSIKAQQGSPSPNVTEDMANISKLKERYDFLSGAISAIKENFKAYYKTLVDARQETETLTTSTNELKIAYDQLSNLKSFSIEDGLKQIDGVSLMTDNDKRFEKVKESTKAVSEMLAQNANENERMIAEYQQRVMALNNLAAATMTDAIGSFAETLTFSGIDDAFAAMLESVANGLSQFGSLLIAQGIAIGAFKKSLETLNPAVAIGAGIALKLAAGAIRNHASSMSKGGSGGGGSSGGYQGIAGQSGRGSTAPDVIYLKLKGNELQATIDMNDRRKQRTG